MQARSSQNKRKYVEINKITIQAHFAGNSEDSMDVAKNMWNMANAIRSENRRFFSTKLAQHSTGEFMAKHSFPSSIQIQS